VPQSNILTELRVKDYPRYTLCLFAPHAQRDDLAALFLLNAELAHIRDQVTEPLLGQIRLQWWRDGLESLCTAAQPPHPLLERLAAWQQSGLDLAPLHQLIDARATDLAADPFPDIESYLAYRAQTSRPLGKIAAALLKQTEHTALYEQAMEHYATIGLLRAVPHWLRRQQRPLPPAWLIEHNINETALAEMRPEAGLARWALATAQSVQKECIILSQELSALPTRKTNATVRLHNDLALWHAKQVLRAKEMILTMPATTPPLITLFWRALRG